jgi:electron transfer flavoprotein beta subunit
MKAKKKPLDGLTLAELGVEPRAQLKIVRFEAPAQRQKGVLVKDVAELVGELRKRGVIA